MTATGAGAAAERAAERIAACWTAERKLGSLPPALRPADLESGYRVQAALAGALGDEVVGWKLAATSERGQRHIGVDGPIAGRLMRARLRRDGDQIPLAGNRMRVAECEFVFALGRDLPPRDAPYTRDEVVDAVAALRPGLELPDSRFEDFASAGAGVLAADDACAHWMVVGEPSGAEWRDADLARHATCLRINGKVVTEGSGADVLGDPRDALAWLANAHALIGDHLRAGQLITTGVTGVPSPIVPGDAIEADLGVFGRVAATIGN